MADTAALQAELAAIAAKQAEVAARLRDMAPQRQAKFGVGQREGPRREEERDTCRTRNDRDERPGLGVCQAPPSSHCV